MNSIERFFEKEKPIITFDDYLKNYRATSQIQTMKHSKFNLVDLGGSFCQKSKWKSCKNIKKNKLIFKRFPNCITYCYCIFIIKL